MRCRLPNILLPAMRNIRLTIEYDGTNYCGWQIQNSAKRIVHSAKRDTIQGTIEEALKKILQEKVKLIGSGRTDSGVHARGQVANFKTKSRLSSTNIQRAVNSLLPSDIRVREAVEVQLHFNSRFEAKSKMYRYTIVNDTLVSPFDRRYCYFFSYPLNVARMRREAKCLIGKHDFKSFQAADKEEKNSTRRIKKLKIKRERDFIYIDIEADGFLHNMARNIVGTLVEAGRGKLKIGSVEKILKAKNRELAGPTASAKGLCLMKVKY